MATTKKTSPTKMATTAIKKKKASSKRSTLTPNAHTYRSRKDGSHVFKSTNEKGKIDYIGSSQDRSKGAGMKSKTFYAGYDGGVTGYAKKPVSYTVTSSSDSNKSGTKHFEKSIDTTGFAAGKKNFTVVSKQKLPGGNMYKITKSKTDRKGALDTINRMKKRARKPFTSSKATSSKPLTTKKK